ncbi:MAG: 30S ribosomal protein S7 [bacterium]
MARSKKEKHIVLPDPLYSNLMVSKLVNYVMKGGKKNTARRIVYDAFEIIKEKTKKEAVEIFEQALINTRPLLEVRPKRIGGATYQVPRPVAENRGTALALRWILSAARTKKGQPMHKKLAEELIGAANNTSAAIKKKENMHKMAEANRAFAHFAW